MSIHFACKHEKCFWYNISHIFSWSESDLVYDTVWENQGFISILVIWRLSPPVSRVSWFPNPSGMRRGQCFIPLMHMSRTRNFILPRDTEDRLWSLVPVILCYMGNLWQEWQVKPICGIPSETELEVLDPVCKEWNKSNKQTFVHKRHS